jgi:hypothetical protein
MLLATAVSTALGCYRFATPSQVDEVTVNSAQRDGAASNASLVKTESACTRRSDAVSRDRFLWRGNQRRFAVHGPGSPVKETP